MSNRSVEARFWAKVAQTDGCWWWLGAPSYYGYGTMAVGGGKKMPAHRYAYELLVGPIPEGLVIDHLCRDRLCVNPEHLEPVTLAENKRRGMAGILKTHCVHGHLFDDTNTYVTREGYRQCRRCKRDRMRAYSRDRAA